MINQRHKRLLKEKKKMRYDKMKHLKLKTGLSALAIAFAVAGAINLQTMAVANAEDNYDASGLTMANGAAVALREDFSGIRWETKINAAWYNNLPSGAKIGVIVLPTSMIGEDGELTYDDSTQILDLAYGEKSEGDNMAEDTVFYSVVNYENIIDEYAGELSNEEALAKAYALELTARAYVNVDGEYQYADLSAINTSRSARQVAIAAELAGEIDKKYREVEENAYLAQKAEAYYGMSEKYTPAVKSTGAVGTPYIDMENPTTTVTVAGWEIAGDFQEAVIGAEKVEATYADGTLTITEATGIPTGENYITVFTSAGVYTQPVIGATKVLRTTDDLKIFNAKGDKASKTTKVTETTDDDGDGKKETTHNYYKEGYWKPEQEQGGYYILGANIEAQGYKHSSGNTSTWNGADNYYQMPIGLTGTFNGMGFAIKDMEIAGTREGFFGIVNGGTVKNVAFMNVMAEYGSGYKYVIANYLLNATLENIYISTNAYANKTGGFPALNSAILAEYVQAEGSDGENVIRNCNIVFNASNKITTDKSHGFLFRVDKSDNLLVKYENVHVACGSNFNANYTITTTNEETGETTSENVKDNVRIRLMYDSEGKVVYLAQNEVEQDGTDENGNPIWKPSSSTSGIYPVANFVNCLGLEYKVLTGVTRHKSLGALAKIADAISWMPAAWLE